MITTAKQSALPNNPFARIRMLWGNYWFLPLIPSAYSLAIWLTGNELRLEHYFFVVSCIGLGYGTRGSKALLLDLYPYVATGLGWDLVRYLRPLFVLPGRVLSCELRNLDSLFYFNNGRTIGETFAARATPVLDLICAVPYTIFVYLVLLYAGYLFFRDRPLLRVYLWAFAIANYISFVCWLLLPAAPPWYVHAHGCAVDLATLPNPAGLGRIDELLQIHYYRDFYARAATPFGAMPSMHCAYPIIGLVSAWRSASTPARLLHLGYTALMAFAAMYLDHHWLVDVIAGWATGVAGVFLARWWHNRRQNAAVATVAL